VESTENSFLVVVWTCRKNGNITGPNNSADASQLTMKESRVEVIIW